jgi:hypothetical protein
MYSNRGHCMLLFKHTILDEKFLVA